MHLYFVHFPRLHKKKKKKRRKLHPTDRGSSFFTLLSLGAGSFPNYEVGNAGTFDQLFLD